MATELQTDPKQSEQRALTPRDKQRNTLRDLVVANQRKIVESLPRQMDAGAFLRFLMQTISRQPELLECDPGTVIASALQAAQLQLEIGGILGLAHIVPFYNSKRSCKEGQLVIGYKGFMMLARRSAQISTLQANTVYDADDFFYRYGDDPKLTHTPSDKADRGKIRYFYAAARLKDGGKQFVVLTNAEVEALRDKQLAGIKNESARRYSPWTQHYQAMGEKTAMRRLFKWLPASVDVQRAVAATELHEEGLPQRLVADFFDMPEERDDGRFAGDGPVSANDLTDPKPAGDKPAPSPAFAKAMEAVSTVGTLEALQAWRDSVEAERESFTEPEHEKLMAALQARREYLEGAEKPKGGGKAKPKGEPKGDPNDALFDNSPQYQ